MIKFNKYNVTNGTHKARVLYSKNGRTDGRECVTLYARDLNGDLNKIFANFKSDTDFHQDYFDAGKVVIFKGDAHYEAAVARC